MSEELFCLKSDTQTEPVVSGWYAWPFLIAPATSAMVTKNLHLPVLESFVRSPEQHLKASRNSAMRGGTFMDFEGSVDSVRELIEVTKSQQARLDLAEAIETLDEMLQERADGGSLQDLYPQVPRALQGLVELVYDLNNQPAFRLIEPLLYRSQFYDESNQAIRLSKHEGDGRAFVLSTPRLGDDALQLHIPFSSRFVDFLYGLRGAPKSLSTIEARASEDGVTGDAYRGLLSFLEVAPASSRSPDNNFAGDGVRIRYFGHATVLIQTRDVSILTDPLISYPNADDANRFTLEDLPDRIDYVVLTHNHQDHVVFETLLQLRHKVRHFVVPRSNGGYMNDPSLKLVLENTGFENVIEICECEGLAVPGGEILGIPFLGEHGDLNIQSKLAYVLGLQNYQILCAVDSNNLSPAMYKRLREWLGPMDVVFIGMECAGAPMSWLYGPLLTRRLSRKFDQARRLDGSDFEKAADIVNQFDPQGVFVYAMGAEPWLTHISSIEYTAQSKPIEESDRLIQMCVDQGRIAERLYGKRELYLNGRLRASA